MSQFTRISYSKDADRFLSLLQETDISGLPSPSQFELESRYRAEELGESFADYSFCVLQGDKVVALVLAHKLSSAIGFYDSGVRILCADDVHKKMLAFILEGLTEIAQNAGCEILKVDDADSASKLSLLGQEAFNRKAHPVMRLRAQQDLTQSKEDIHSQLRQRYKGFVNKGRREIEFGYITSDQISKENFDNFREFHKAIAGRQTRPVSSWDVQFEMIEQGCAEVVLGYLEPHGLVSSALFVDYGDTTSYAVAVYNRDLFDKPLAHANVYEGMLRAKARGQKLFNLGVVPSHRDSDEKEYNIGNFKKGFCRQLTPIIEWQIDCVDA